MAISGPSRRRFAHHAARRVAQNVVTRTAVAHPSNRPFSIAHPHCARILLSVLQTLLHGAFVWLQPRSPVVVVVESGRDPDPLDAKVAAAAVVVVGSVQAAGLAAAASPPAERENRRAAGESLRPGVRAAAASHRRVGPAA